MRRLGPTAAVAAAEMAAAAETDLEALTAADAVAPVVDVADLVGQVDAADLVDLVDRADAAATVDHALAAEVAADHEGGWVASTVTVHRAHPQDRLKHGRPADQSCRKRSPRPHGTNCLGCDRG
jgi:hypothetical protein